jgi:hypothetical protein
MAGSGIFHCPNLLHRNERSETVGTMFRTNRPSGTLGSAISRAAGFFGFWLVLTDADSVDLAAGSVAAVAATWTSLRLMPAEQWSLRPIKLAELVLHFLRQSIAAGTDVALRAQTDLGNPVAGVLFVYRSLDTLLEKVVLLLALLGVRSLAPDSVWGGIPGQRVYAQPNSTLTFLAHPRLIGY